MSTTEHIVGSPMRAEVSAVLRRTLAAVAPALADIPGDAGLVSCGLDSMTAARLLLEAEFELGVTVPVTLVREAAGLDDLAGRIAALMSVAEGTGADTMEPGTAAPQGDPAEPFGLTPMQETYLVGRHPAMTADPVGCRLYRDFSVVDLDVARLRTAWHRVADRHDMLRAELTDDQRQRVVPGAPGAPFTVHEVDEADFDARVSRVRAEWSGGPTAVADRPLSCVDVTLAPGGRAVVHLDVDGLLVDGRGLDTVLADWWRFYRAPDRSLPEPPLTVRECVTSLLARRDTSAHQVDLDHWAGRFAELPDGPDLLLADPPAPPPTGYRRTPFTGRLPAGAWAAVREKARTRDVSPTALVLSVFADTLARFGAGRPFSLVLTTSDRSRLPATADLLAGPFTSSMVLAVEPGADASVLHDRLWTDLAHAGSAAVEALRSVRRERPPTLPVVFTSMIGAVDEPAGGFADPQGWGMCQTSGVALDHQMWEEDGRLRIRWDVVVDLFPADLVPTLFAHFTNALFALAADRPDGAVTRPMNDLQQAYYVARCGGQTTGCQLYQSFAVPDLDVSRLAGAWLRLLDAYPALRTRIAPDGTLTVHDDVPVEYHVPMLREGHPWREMTERPFPFGGGPHTDLRVTTDGTVHLAVDLAIADARSIVLLGRELMRCYADADAVPRPVSASPETLDRQDTDRDRAHWRGVLADLPDGPQWTTGGGGQPRTRLAATVPGWDLARTRLAEHGISVNAAVLTAFTDALARHHPEPFTVSVVRWREEADACRPGEFTALSWFAAEDGPSALERARAYDTALTADAAADGVSGLAELRRRVLRVGGAPAYSVVYTSVFDLAGHPLPAGVTAGPWQTCTPDVSLDCVSIDTGAELEVAWDVAPAELPDGMPAAAFARFTAWLTGLTGLTGDDDAWPTRDEPRAGVLHTEERHRIVHGWNDTEREFPHDRPVHCLFEDHTRQTPHAVALRWRGGSMTYRELNHWANHIAWRLRDRGVGPGTAVAIAMSRGPGMVAAVFGVLKAGGLYLPVEPHLPAERAAMMLADAEAELVLVDDADRWVPPQHVRTLLVHRDQAAEDPRTNADPDIVSCVDDLAYVIFTSGSTGRPKGVAVTHRPVLNLLNWCYRTFAFGPDDVGLCVTSLGFDLSVFDILGLLGRGAGLYIADAGEQRDPALLLEVLVREPITFWNSAPTTLNQVARYLPRYAGDPGTAGLRLVFLSGDYTPLPLPDEVRSVFTSASIVSLGGATEATVWSNWFPVGEVDPLWRSIPYGRPIDNARYYVLDDELEPCPAGIEGDLYIGGGCLSQGYVNRPDLTREAFVPDPFVLGPAPMYRTGDRASFFPDGTICFLGRVDTQVKIRGFRVELGEIEHRLRLHEAVKDAVVLARADDTGDRRLVAYVIPADAANPPSTRDLRAFAGEALPDYMVPNLVATVGMFPATANGKLDRDALPWPLTGTMPASVASGGTGPTEPELREVVATLFSEKLGGAPVAQDDDLWDLGATSFTLMRVSGELEARYGSRIPVAAVVADPTASGIARHLAGLLGATPVEPAAPVPAPVVGGARAAPVDFFSAEDRARFKAANPGERAPREDMVPLDAVEHPAERYLRRASSREFAPGPVPASSFAALLSLLRSATVDGRPRRLYPSAGDTYAVQVYLTVKTDRVEGVAGGAYYYRPVDHALQHVGSAASIGRSVHFYYNRPLFDAAAFEIYLVGQLTGIEPLYGPDSARFLALEAGYLGQVLMDGQRSCHIGLCPVGAVAFDQVRPHLDLDDGHVYLQAFLGGAAGAGGMVR